MRNNNFDFIPLDKSRKQVIFRRLKSQCDKSWNYEIESHNYEEKKGKITRWKVSIMRQSQMY